MTTARAAARLEVLIHDRTLLVAALLAGAAWSAQSLPGAWLSYLVGVVGLVALHESLRLDFDRDVALLTTLLTFAGTSLFWSMIDASAISAMAFAIVAVALWLWRYQTVPRIVMLVAVSAAALAPLLLEYLRRRSGLTVDTAEQTSWSAVLFSSSHGLLSLTPVAYIALAGTVLSLHRQRLLAVMALGLIALWLIGNRLLPHPSLESGHFDHGLTAALAVLAPGLAFLIERARARPWLAVAPLLVAALLWNYWLMVQYTVGTLPKDEPVSFAALVRQQAEVHTRSPYWYPFAFPANVWFAWREGVPVERYELLAFEPRRESLDLTLDRATDRFVLSGWEALPAEGAGAPRWIREPRATVAVPLAIPSASAVDVIVTARARLEQPPMDAEIGVEINEHEIARLVVSAANPQELRLRVPAEAVGRIFTAGYNRITFVSHGIRRADPLDQRPPGPLASRPDRVWPVAIHRLQMLPVVVVSPSAH